MMGIAARRHDGVDAVRCRVVQGDGSTVEQGLQLLDRLERGQVLRQGRVEAARV
ncbi:hypothetical protein [Jiangella ureilytica]|uniref:hypothetical protein n=1 Tax=Jiangella ureilytica TaxID=2530374 RepID=UPI0013A5CFD2|nr:hypothetical protein [Jiangella ureilytica]